MSQTEIAEAHPTAHPDGIDAAREPDAIDDAAGPVGPAGPAGPVGPLHGVGVFLLTRPGSFKERLRAVLEDLGCGPIDSRPRAEEAETLLMHRVPGILIVDQDLGGGQAAQSFFERVDGPARRLARSLFAIVSDDRQYRSVMSVAEVEPDLCLIRPLEVAEAERQLLQAWARKRQLDPLQDALDLEGGRTIEARVRDIARHHPELRSVAWRIASAWLVRAGQIERAETMAREALLTSQPAWAFFRLAQVRQAGGRIPEALQLLQRAIDVNPRHLQSLDLLASLHEQRGHHEQALACLDRLSAQTQPSAERMRRTGRLAEQTGDLRRAEEALRWQTSRVTPGSAEADANRADLMRVLQAQGRVGTAQALHRSQIGRLAAGSPDARLLEAVFQLEVLVRRSDGNAGAGAERLLEFVQTHAEEVGIGLCLRAIRACAQGALRAQGFAIATVVSRSRRAERGELEHLRGLLTQLSAIPHPPD